MWRAVSTVPATPTLHHLVVLKIYRNVMERRNFTIHSALRFVTLRYLNCWTFNLSICQQFSSSSSVNELFWDNICQVKTNLSLVHTYRHRHSARSSFNIVPMVTGTFVGQKGCGTHSPHQQLTQCQNFNRPNFGVFRCRYM